MPVWWNGRHQGLKIPCRKRRTGSSPVTGTIMNESRFSNYFIEKRDLSYPESLAIWGFSLFHILTLLFQNAPNAKLIFLYVVSI